MLDTPGAALEATRLELLRLFRRAFSLFAKVLNYETGELRASSDSPSLATVPKKIETVDVDDLYRRRIKPLHGLILDYMARLSVTGRRAQQLLLLRVASQDLVEAVKDAKHLQKNLVTFLKSENNSMRAEYLDLRHNLGLLLGRLDRIAAADTAGQDELELELAEMSANIEAHDIVHNGRLDVLIREQRITPEQATSLMNDNAYSYRISKNLLAMARATFQPLESIDTELREVIELKPHEVQNILAESNPKQAFSKNE
jgi:phosphate:Na+ symporter